MDVTPDNLVRFRESLVERGMSAGTVDLYALLVRTCARHPKGLLGRLVDADLAPKSLHANRAAIMAWARFAEDDELERKLKRMRLPPSVRVNPKTEFATGLWRDLAAGVRADRTLPPAMRATLLLITVRGLRCSDALRVRRAEVATALRTGRLGFEGKGRRRQDYDVRPIREALELLHAQKGDWVLVEDLLVSRRCRASGAARRKMAAQAVRRSLLKIALKIAPDDARGGSVYPHRFRRTQATEFLRRMKGDPQALPKLMTYMGWSSMATALQYVDAVDKDQLDNVGNDMAKDLLT